MKTKTKKPFLQTFATIMFAMAATCALICTALISGADRVVIADEEASGTVAIVPDVDVVRTWGNWSLGSDKLSASNGDTGDAFATTNVYAPKDKDLYYSITAELTQGAMMLAFGVADYNDPGAKWFAVNYNVDNGIARLFAVNQGTIGAAIDAHVYTVPEDKKAGKHVLAVSMKANGALTAYVDDNIVCDTLETQYNGGYLAIGTWLGAGTFTDWKYSLTDPETTVYTTDGYIDVDMNNFRSAYEWGERSYYDGIFRYNDIGHYWDECAMTTLYASKDQNLVFEADVKAESGGAGLLLGVPAINDPGSVKYGFFFNKGDKIARAFSWNEGSLGAALDEHLITLNDAMLAREYNHLKIVYEASTKIISFYMDGQVVESMPDPLYNGGYIGFFNNNSDTYYKNIVVSITDGKQPVSYRIVPTDSMKNTWGIWSYDSNSVNIVGDSWWNLFATTNVYAPKDKDLYYKATVELESGTVMINFGIADYNDPGVGWFALNFNGDGVARLFAANTGTIGENISARSYVLPESERAGKHVLAVRMRTNGRLTAYIDDHVVSDTYESQYNGGYLALGTFYGTAKFTDWEYTLTEPEEASYTTDGLIDVDYNNFRSRYEWGNINYADGVLSYDNVEHYWDECAMTTLYAGRDQDLVFEADVKAESGGAGLLFGVPAINDPGSVKYGFFFNKGEKIARAFSWNEGSLGAALDEHLITLNDAMLAREYNHLKIVYEASTKIISFYMDGQVVESAFDPLYNGGYIGFFNNNSKTLYKNVKVSISDVDNGGEQPSEEPDETLARIVYTSGTYWKANGKTLTAANPTVGNAFAVTDIFVDETQNLEFCADVTVKSGTAMLTFGVSDKDNPSASWYAFNYRLSDGLARLFSVNGGSLGDSLGMHELYLPADKKDGTHKLTVIAKASGAIKVTIDEYVVCDTYDSWYRGGYIGFGTFYGTATFENASVKTTAADGSYYETDNVIDYRVSDYHSFYRWMNWSIGEDNSLTGANNEFWDMMNMSVLKQEVGQTLVFEADMKVTGPDAMSAAGLVFGADLINDPGAAWYSFMLNKPDDVSGAHVRAFGVNTGTIGADVNAHRYALSAAQKAAEYVNLKVIARANGVLSFYLDGVKLEDYYDAQFHGGYIGFYTILSTTTWKNIKVSLTTDEPAVENISLVDLELDFNSDTAYYYLETSTLGTVVDVTASSDYEVYINGINTAYDDIKLQDGGNMIEIKAVNKKTGKASYYNVKIGRYYMEPMRPGIHLTTKENWLNDPNGLMYDAETGLYHLFVQWAEDRNNGGEKLWYHYVSTDLINWQDKGQAIHTNEVGAAWSGGGVIDYNNTSGLFTDDVPAASRMVTFVTYHSNEPKIGVCYSLDQGETWLEYHTPVIMNEGAKYGDHFRDPKVVWVEDDSYAGGGVWIMVTGGWAPIRLFSSENLIDWKYEGLAKDFFGQNINSECPDLFPLAVDGDENNIKWVITTAGTSYIVGDLKKVDGTWTFNGVAPQTKIFTNMPLWTNRGELYATQSFFNDKLGRRILMSWMIDNTADLIEGKTWNGAQSLPVSVELVTVNGMYSLKVSPVEELKNNYDGQACLIEDTTLSEEDGELEIAGLYENLYDLTLTLDVGTAKKATLTFAADETNQSVLTLDFENDTATLDLTQSGKYLSYSITSAMVPENGKVTVRLVMDVSIVEVFINDTQNMESYVFPPEGATGVRLNAYGGAVTIERLVINYLKSIHEVNL